MKSVEDELLSDPERGALNLTAAECRMLRQVVAMIRKEHWPTGTPR